MTQKLLTFQAPSQVGREPISVVANLAQQHRKRRCFATCTTGSVSYKRKNREPFDKRIFCEENNIVLNQKLDEEQFSDLTEVLFGKYAQ